MTEGVDYAFPPLPTARGLADVGKRFAGRYVGPGSGKFLTAPERDALFAEGIDIFLLVEGEADSARGGRPVGQQHAQLALDHARSLGAPVDRLAFYHAVDYDLATSDWPTAADYLRGAGDVLGVARVGVYGEHDVMAWAARDGVAAWFFQTYAWSYGAWFAGNHVEQYLNTQQVAGGEVDLCRARQANFGQWSAKGTASRTECDMLRFIQADGQQFIIFPDATSPTGFAWVSYGAQVQPQIRILTDSGAIPTVDARHQPNADASWLVGAFGPSAAESRAQLLADLAAKVIADLPPSAGGSVDLAAIAKAVNDDNARRMAG